MLGSNTNDVAQGPAGGYGGSLVSSNVAAILSGTNTVQYSLTMPGYSSYYLRANIGLLDVVHPLPAESIWAAAVSGSWSKAGNWTGGVPDATGAGAVINVATSAALTITLDAPQTVGTLLLGNSQSASLSYTLLGSGSNTLTFSNSGYGATITVANGSHVIDAPVVLADNLVVSGSGTLAFGSSNSITGGYALTMNGGGGTLILSGTDSYTGGTTVAGGTLYVTKSPALAAGSSLTVGGGGTFIFDPSLTALPTADGQTSAWATSSAVPEPGTLALLLAGLVAGLAATRRKGV